MTPRFAGAFAASLTPLTAGAEGVDVDAVPQLVDFLAGAGIDGMLALGTTGEGILLDRAERRAAVGAFAAASRGRLTVIAHCGAQTTRETSALCADAAEAGADAVAVIPPPYFALDEQELLQHLVAAARASAPLPFFVYEFAARSGYAVPPPLLAELGSRVPNLTGLKVSDPSWESVQPYILDGLAVFVGQEVLLDRALAAGAAGAVSGLAAALPEVVVEAVRSRSREASQCAGEVRGRLARFPFHAAMKRVLAARGLAVGGDVRAPLRSLTATEKEALDAELPALLALAGAVAPASS
jgi:4-hydroxy-tetrahydrodipicolinate synthase